MERLDKAGTLGEEIARSVAKLEADLIAFDPDSLIPFQRGAVRNVAQRKRKVSSGKIPTETDNRRGGGVETLIFSR